MLTALRQPKWRMATLTVMVLAVVFVRLGFWQLERLEERRLENSTGSERLNSPVVPFGEIADPTVLEFQRVQVAGEFDPSQEVLIRSQTHLGAAGFHVVTPLVGDRGAVLVNRGWVPLTLDGVPVDEAPPPPGQVTVEGWISGTQERPRFGPEDPSGTLEVFNRVDIARIQEQVDPRLAGAYVVAFGADGQLPEPVDPPNFDDQGPHLAYAIQWFGFAVTGIIGLVFLLAKHARPAGS